MPPAELGILLNALDDWFGWSGRLEAGERGAREDLQSSA